MDPLRDVVRSTAAVMAQASHVSISQPCVDDFCRSFSHAAVTQIADHTFDTELHYVDPVDPEGTVQYLLVVDALNFCFWPTPGLEYEHLSKGVKAAVQRDKSTISAERLAQSTEDHVAQLFLHQGPIPHLTERTRLLREVGSALLEHFGGLAANLVRAAQNSAARLVSLLTAHCPGFRDHAVYRGQQIFLYKRAQIFVGDLWGAFRGQGLGAFDDIDRVTMFADYRVPVVLQQQGVLQYSAALADKIARQEQIAPGSEEEIEIRAATIQAVQQIQAKLAALGRNTGNEGNIVPNSVQLDWYLWETGEQQADKATKHHRTLTVYY